ncbi:ABC transporter ATP-binding protein [Hutsoniella sourekii]
MSVEIKQANLSLGGRLVLDQINLTVQAGEFLSILGPSGAGKSSLLKAMAGILSLDNGEIVVDGKKVTSLNTYFSYMPQEAMLLDWLTVSQNITLYQSINQIPIDQSELMEMLEMAGLIDFKEAMPHELSGGMRQRVAFLRTLMNPSKYLLLDEPLGALDAMTRNLMQDWLLELLDHYPRTTILVTHDIDEAIYLSDRICLLSQRPAQVERIYNIDTNKRSRQWLAGQGTLRNEIYQQLQANSYL